MSSPTERIAGLIAAKLMTNAADALTRHQGQANKVRTKATRTTMLTAAPGGWVIFRANHFY